MSSIRQLLLPCCFSDSRVPTKIENKACFSSASAHALTSLAVTLVIGVGIALATYFLAHENIMWSAISGVSGGIMAGSICYLILRYTFGKTSRKISSTETESGPDEIKRNEPLSPRLNPDQDNSSIIYPNVSESATAEDNLWYMAIGWNNAEVKKSKIPNTVGHTRHLAQPAQFNAYEFVKKTIPLVPADITRESELTIMQLLLGTKNTGASEWTIDLSNEPEHPKITEEQIEKLLKENPLVRDLTVLIDPNLRETWSPDFKALNQHFQAESIIMPYLCKVPQLLIRYRRKCDSLESAITHLKSK